MFRLVGHPAVFVLVLVMLAGCGGGDIGERGAVGSGGEGVPQRLREAARECPVTIPENEAGRYGAGGLETALSGSGLIVAVLPGARSVGDALVTEASRPDGPISVKFPWWRAAGVSGRLRIGGRGLGGQPGAVRALIPGGYGPRFQPSAIIFPDAGCWEVTAAAGGARVRLVVFVVNCVSHPAGCRAELS